MHYETVEGLSVNVDQVIYTPEFQGTQEKPYTFVYCITIQNDSEQTVKILARKWVVLEENGEYVVVEGEGVVGEKPTLRSGESYSYNSAHVVASNALSSGAFFGLTESGHVFNVKIPSFKMHPPLV